MKNISYKIFGILICSLFLNTSCFKEKLELVPSDGITDESYFTTEENAEAALIPMYRGRAYWRLPSFLWEFYGDRSGTGSWSGPSNVDANQFSNKSVTPENSQLDDSYRYLYDYINHANIFLYNVDNVTFKNPERKDVAKGEAMFIRAMYYHMMTLIWGSVPNITTLPFPLYPSRATEEENYTQIITDLEWAINHLPETNIGVLRPGEWECRPDVYSAKAYLAKVLLTAPESFHDKERALSLINDVIESGKYQLESFYGDLMMVDNKDNKENIFMINFTNSNSDGSNAASLAVPGQIWFRATPEFYESFEEGDTRRDVNILYFELFNEYYIKKMGYDERAVNGFTFDNYPQYILRLADMYLLKAEVLVSLDYEANIDEACEMIEIVRNRAFEGEVHKIYTSDDFSGLNDFMEFLWWERRKELYYEGHCFFDAKRMGFCQTKLGLDKWQEILPFSTSNLTLNPNLKQNANY